MVIQRNGQKLASGKRRSKRAKVRLKAFWGVYNDLLQRVALFEYSERQQAEAVAKEMSESHKSSYFVRPVKRPVE